MLLPYFLKALVFRFPALWLVECALRPCAETASLFTNSNLPKCYIQVFNHLLPFSFTSNRGLRPTLLGSYGIFFCSFITYVAVKKHTLNILHGANDMFIVKRTNFLTDMGLTSVYNRPSLNVSCLTLINLTTVSHCGTVKKNREIVILTVYMLVDVDYL